MADAVLSQAEIDSLVGGQREAPAVGAGPGGTVFSPSLPRVAAPLPSAASPVEGRWAELQERLENTEAVLRKTGELGRELHEARASIIQMQQVMQAMTAHLQAVTGQMQAISTNLQGTPGYGLQKAFTCTSCHSTGFVATPIRCTHCGQESWWGYWPQPK
ncbi:MAG: hypothetical protein HW388_813 [Dehalococcoidia bacterium]|nr:hypothetical protein [Dehalococcoidia bacterium]